MTLVSRIFNVFKISTDADISVDIIFKTTFTNVVNFIMLAQSLFLGLYSMFVEEPVLATLNMTFSLLFMTYFVLMFVVKQTDIIEAIVRVAFFLFFVVIFASTKQLNVIGISIALYPFVAIVLHGRKIGVLLSCAQMALIVVYLITGYFFIDLYNTTTYSFENLLLFCVAQFIAIFVFYVAIRWLTGMVYDKNREISILTEEMRVKSELIDKLTSGIDKPLKEISEASSILSSERLNTLQSELVSLIRASSLSATNSMSAVIRAASRNIPVVPIENVKFNLYSMLSSMLKLYKCADPNKRHAYSVGSDVPEILLGNSALTRQVLLNVLDALETKTNLAENTLKVTVSREDVFDKDIVLHFSLLLLDAAIDLDKRDISSSKSKEVDFLELGITRRIVEAEGCYFNVTIEKDGLHVDFSLHYKDGEDHLGIDSDMQATSAVHFDKTVLLKDTTVLLMTEDNMLWAQASQTLGPYVHDVKRSRTADETIDIFINSVVDIVITDLRSDNGNGRRLVNLIRNAESGLARKIPVLCFTDPEIAATNEAAAQASFDTILRLPYDEDVVRAMVSSYFM